jgi:toxin ParE1/3/4
MKAKYSLSDKALADLDDIWYYTLDTWSERQAERYYKMLIDCCQQVAEKPAQGKNYDRVAVNLQGFGAGRHIIFYRVVSPDEVTIVRILHGGMDLKNRIDE